MMESALAALRSENAALRAALVAAGMPLPQAANAPAPDAPRAFDADHDLSAAEVERYCRQMLLPSFGVEGEW